MPHIRHLRNAPIIEAVFDFKVKAASDFQAEDFKVLREELAPRFPIMEAAHSSQVRIEFKAAPPDVNTEHFGHVGYFFKSQDGKQIAQFRVDGFTLNKLAPYTSWDELFPIATELWGRYRDVATPQTVTRLAIRYINHIDLPWDVADFDDYLRAGPIVPKELPQLVPAFLLQSLIVDSELDIAANVTQRLQTSPSEHKHTVILDIDAFKTVDLPPDDLRIEGTINQLRVFKNEIFFNFLTEAAIGRYE